MKKMKAKRIRVIVLLAFFIVTVIVGFKISGYLNDCYEEDKKFAFVENEVTSDALSSESQKVHSLEHLHSMNTDSFGWISIPDTALNYPVMYTPDLPDKYAALNFFMDDSNSGTPYMDSRCNTESDNFIIYGKNVLDGSQFGSLKKYLDEEYLNAHPLIIFETPNGVRKYTVFAVVKTDSSDEWFDFVSAEDFDEYDSYAMNMCAKANVKHDKSPYSKQHLLTLSTSDGVSSEKRILVIAKEEKNG